MRMQTTRGELVKQGLNILSSEGLSGVTIGRVAQAGGLSKSGLFAHFRSRNSLEIALLEEAARLARYHVVEPAMREAEGLPRLHKLVALWLGWSARAGLPGGCPIAAALFELDDVGGKIRDHVAALDEEWRGLLRALVGDAVDRGHLGSDTDLDQFVWELCGIYLSHHVSSRFHRSAGIDRRAEVAFEDLLRRNASNSDHP